MVWSNHYHSFICVTVDISASSGFGEWDTTGTGRNSSWHAAIGNTLDDDDGILERWRRTFSTGKLDEERYTALHHELQRYLDM
ncbi:MAG TPA: hypothetical protein VHZ51_08795 [Ktedonobacteraceae bacterium]|nr:hypothetical protein [Ktedonobacteraceae bacterium]